MSKLDQIIKDIQNELGADFLYMEVVGTDGLSIANANVTNIDVSAVAARFTMVGKLASRVADKLNLGALEENLITIQNGYGLMHELGDGSYFVVLGLAKDAALGVARMLLKDYSEQLWDAIPR
jgi:predicted regulator of Ras-like GTPase activity (Roadblock/LC7/MglB family)